MKKLFILIAIISLQFGNLVAAAPISDEQRRLMQSGVSYFNIEDDCGEGTVSGSGSVAAATAPGPVYMLGDSITVGINSAGLGDLLKEHQPLTVDASTGRSITGGGTDGNRLSGLAAVDANPDAIKAAKFIVIGLGTNPGGSVDLAAFGGQIEQLIGKIKALNSSAPISWLNIVSTSSAQYPERNKIINASAKSGYSVIDARAANIPLSGDKIHPNTEGYKALASLIKNKLTGGATDSTTSAGISCCAASTGVSTNLNGKDNIDKVWNYLIGKGLTKIQAAGAMGNLQTEGNFNPKIVERGTWGGRKWGGESDTVPPPVGPAGQPGYGIVQWTSPGRKAGLVSFSEKSNPKLPVNDLGLQLDYMWSELEGPYKKRALDPLRAATDLAKAVSIWQDKYEVGQNFQPRMNNAVAFLKKYESSTPSAAVTVSGTDESPQACLGATGPGQDTQYLDGFTVYNQFDPAWKDKPYASSTMGESGCGPAAMAMIITALTGKAVTPVETANYAASIGMYIPGAGSSWEIAPKLAQKWGLKSQPVGKDLAKITASLQAGGLIFISGSGPKPFTTGGHMLVIRGITASGKFKVGDSGHNDTSDKEWDPNLILSTMNAGSAYAITK